MEEKKKLEEKLEIKIKIHEEAKRRKKNNFQLKEKWREK